MKKLIAIIPALLAIAMPATAQSVVPSDSTVELCAIALVLYGRNSMPEIEGGVVYYCADLWEYINASSTPVATRDRLIWEFRAEYQEHRQICIDDPARCIYDIK